MASGPPPASPVPQQGPALPFAGVEDSPLFRSRVVELEAAVDSLKARGTRFVKDARKLCEGVDVTYNASSAFADALERFCGARSSSGGTDEESMELGGPLLLKFVSTFRELASFQDLLRTQLEVVLCERLNHTLAGLLSEEREARRRLDKQAGAYDAARLKHLGHKNVSHISTWSKSSDPEKTQAGMLAAKGEADVARYELARKLVEIEGAKKHLFIDAMITGMDAHLRYFERSLALFQGLQPYLQHSLDVVEKLKAEAGTQAAALELMIAQHQSEEAAARAASGAADTAERPTGPLQMTAGTTSLASEMELFIRQTQESGGKVVTVLRQGYLLKQASNALQSFQRRYFCLSSDGLLWYYSNKDRSRGDSREGRPQNTVNLLTATVKPDAEDPSLKYAFRVVSPEKELTLQAESAADAAEWMAAIQSVIACLLGGAISSPAQLPRKPSRPTHSRAGSVDISALSLGGVAGEGPLGGGLAAAAAAAAAATRAGEGSGLPTVSEGSISSLPLPRAPSTAAASSRPGSALGGELAVAAVAGAALPPPPPGGPLEVLRGVPGNAACVDCGAPAPDWASLNLCVLCCISCSGVHRRLGVHVSKVRSLTLDVKVWEPTIVALFQRLGNDFANSLWEGRLQDGGASAAAGAAGASRRAGSSSLGVDPFSAESDDEADVLETARRAAAAAAAGPGSGGAALPTRPGPAASDQEREAFITAKYVDRAFIVRPALPPGNAAATVLAAWLWEAVARGDLGAAYAALAAGADVNARFSSQPSAQLVWESNLQAGGADDQPVSPSNLGGVTALHAACRTGDPLIVELLVQCGANVDAADVFRRTPLHYAILYGYPEVAKLLLRRGASPSRDREGRSPEQMAAGHSCGRDSELLALLSKAV